MLRFQEEREKERETEGGIGVIQSSLRGKQINMNRLLLPRSLKMRATEQGKEVKR